MDLEPSNYEELLCKMDNYLVHPYCQSFWNICLLNCVHFPITRNSNFNKRYTCYGLLQINGYVHHNMYILNDTLENNA